MRLIDFVSLNLRLKDLLGPVTRVKKKKKKTAHNGGAHCGENTARCPRVQNNQHPPAFRTRVPQRTAYTQTRHSLHTNKAQPTHKPHSLHTKH